MRILINLVLASAIALTLCPGCGTNDARVSSGSTKPQRAKRSKVQSVQLYSDIMPSGRIVLQMRSGHGAMIYANRDRRQHSWTEVTFDLSSRELEQFQRVDYRNLQQFHPKLAWFAGSMPPPDSGSVLVVLWDDRDVSLAVPPSSMRSGLPEKARKQYKNIDHIVDLLLSVRSSRWENGSRRNVANASPSVKAYLEDEDEYVSRSEPLGRLGW